MIIAYYVPDKYLPTVSGYSCGVNLLTPTQNTARYESAKCALSCSDSVGAKDDEEYGIMLANLKKPNQVKGETAKSKKT
jgi:hypothetical protein